MPEMSLQVLETSNGFGQELATDQIVVVHSSPFMEL